MGKIGMVPERRSSLRIHSSVFVQSTVGVYTHSIEVVEMQI